MSDRIDIIQRMKQRPIVLDGAMGTMIYKHGVFINVCYDELNLSKSDLVSQIHREYVQAGADAIETNTFGANPMKLRAHGLAERCGEINRAAVALARAEAGDELYVLGSVGPCTTAVQAWTERKVSEEVAAAFGEQIDALVDAGVDAILLETFSNLHEIELAVEAASRHDVPIIASVSANQDGVTAAGSNADAVIRALDANAHVGAVGLNCGMGPGGMIVVLPKILPHVNKPMLAMPNAGMPRVVGGRTLYLSSPEFFTEYAKRFVEMGARGVGGCCGTNPEDIAEAARAVKSLSGVKEHVTIEAAPTDAQAVEVEVIPPEKKSRFAARLCAGERVTSVEMLPPKTGSLEPMLDKCRQCRDAGVDAINVPDGPRASARISPMITSLAIEQKADIESVLHYCCRDRNLIGMQSDLLGGYAAGLRNFLIVTGDPPKLGNYPDATGVFDVDAIGLSQVCTNLNYGRDIGGAPIDPPTGIFIGVGANPVAVELEREIERYFAKIDAGAEFAITQPVFDTDALIAFLDRVEQYEKTIPVIAGVWPLLSYRNAEFMNSEVPGVEVPENVLKRMEACRTKEQGRAEGVAIAREAMEKIASRVQGFQVSAPLGILSIAMKVLDGVEEL